MEHRRRRDLWLRSPYGQEVTGDVQRLWARMRLGVLALSITIDLVIWFTMRGVPQVRQPVLRAFTIINISALALEAVLNAAVLAARRRPPPGFDYLCIFIEVATSIFWVQVTGSVSSYFIIVGPILIILYRGYHSHAAALACFAMLVLCHGGAVVAEEMGLVRAAGLFVDSSGGIYQLPQFRHAAILSILSVYSITFIGANFFINQLRAQERALQEARRDLARVAEGARHGRLSNVRMGPYVIGELLGRGAMGEVYVGRRDDGILVALKIMHPHLLDNAVLLERFQREAEMAWRVRGDYSPELIEVGRNADGIPFIAMRYLRGEDLGAYMRRRGPLPLAEVLQIARGIGEALDAVHAAKVVHRDLKPANVFLATQPDGPPAIKLLDFGIAKLREGQTGLTHDAELIGTPNYMSPEQARGQVSAIGPASDRFSFGSLLYRALTGVVPFEGASPMDILFQVRHATPPAPSTLVAGLPVDVDAVFTIALAKRPEDRHPSAGALVRDLQLASRGELPEDVRRRAAKLMAERGDDASDGDTWVDLPRGMS